MEKINSRAKGARGELELAKWLTERGYPARRGQQFCGTEDSPDVVCEALDEMGIQIECKRVERFLLYTSLEQAERDAGPKKAGVVFHRQNKRDWVVVLTAEAFLSLVSPERRIKGMSDTEITSLIG